MKRRQSNPGGTNRSKQLKRESTFPERLLWSKLRKHQINGLHFRRQHPLAGFLVDFCCEAQRLIIEIDGLSHTGQASKDQARQDALERLGYRVLRFTNDDVLQHLDAVLAAIAQATSNTDI